MRIIFSGGGTLGSVTPLLAIYETYSQSAQAIWIGTKNGSEKELICAYRMPFRAIFSGKFRRYFSIQNFLDPFLLCVGLIQAIRIILVFQPDIVIGSGGYVSVPVIWAAWLFKKKVLILQLDMQPSLANVLTRFCAQGVALACEEQKKYFQKNKTVVIGIPVRKKVVEFAQQTYDEKNKASLRISLGISDDTVPVVLIMGGGTGALFINDCVCEALEGLTQFCHVVHVTGKGKSRVSAMPYHKERYHAFEFLGETLLTYMDIADCVVTRAGMGTLSELSVLGKPTIIIPIPRSHQEKNAIYFERQKHAALYLSQDGLTGEKLTHTIQRVLKDDFLKKELSDNMRLALPQGGAERMQLFITEMIK